MLSETDANGITTNYSYDNFSRLIKIIKPFDSNNYPSTIYEYEFDGIAPEKVKTSQRETNATNNTFDSYSFYDGFGNIIQQKSESANSNEQIITDTFFDSSMRIQRKSNPYFATFNANYSQPNASIAFSNISYDPISRIIKTTNPDNTSKSFNYSKWNTTITDENGNQIKQVQDAYSQILEIHEFNSNTEYTTKYSYSAAYDLLNITDNENNVFKFTYDTLGRKTSLIDPDLGIWNYSYDAASNLIKQVDNRSTVITLSYDKLNRLTMKNSSSERINFTYDSKLNGTLSSIKTQNYTFNYTYDARYRKSQELRTIENNSSLSTFTYDNLDRIKTITLPNLESITYNYTNSSQLQSINGILPLLQYNAFGKPTQRTYANSLTTTLSYDQASSRLSRIYTANLKDLNYQYDNASNILQIQDAVNSIVQTMQYDQLNRLTYASRSDNSNQHENYAFNYSYSSIGNILSITENNANTISTYSYSNSPVHSPKSIAQTGPILEIRELQQIQTNQTTKTFRFLIQNNGNANIGNINYTFFTGTTSITSTIPISLTAGESIFVYIAYNYSNSTNYKITARASNLTLSHQLSLFTNSNFTNATNSNSNLTQTFLYDANGNTIQDASNYYEYNSFNQLAKIRVGNSTGAIISEYLYDPDGNRIRKLDKIKNETTFYFSQNFQQTINSTGTFNTSYYFDGSQLIARKDPDGKKYFYHPDHLGSTTLVTNESGAI